MAVLLLDTDVFSFLCSRDPRRALPYRQHLNGHVLAVSFATVGEHYAGYLKQILKGSWTAAHLTRLETHLEGVGIIPYDVDVCRTYGNIRAVLMQAQRTVATNDLWIAATAIRHSIPLVTNNRKHFAVIPGLNIISETP
jgi:tRNA(fMet)-specific endonuclease VapC